jgi:hypothetical protein
MTPRSPRWPDRRSRHGRFGTAALISLLAGLTCIASGEAWGWAAASGPATATAPRASTEQGIRWRDLRPSQQAALKPLEREWSGIGAAHKQKWVELSADIAKRSPAEQARIQERMTAWAQLTPQQRSQARFNFQEAKQLNAAERKARWEAYQALTPAQKQELLAARAARTAAKPAARPESNSREPQVKTNIVPNPALATSPKVIAPTVVQARPGATTTPITKRPTPPSHQQAGLPKIAATPEFVNKSTLLPRRGPQGAAATATSATTTTRPTSAPSPAR